MATLEVRARKKAQQIRVNVQRNNVKLRVKQPRQGSGKLRVGSRSTYRGSPKLQNAKQVNAQPGRQVKAQNPATLKPSPNVLQKPARYNPQQPVKKKRRFTSLVYDDKIGDFKEISSVQNLTDDQWEHVQAVNDKKVELRREFDAMRSQYTDLADYKNAVFQQLNDRAKRTEVQIEWSRKYWERVIGRYAQRANNANTLGEFEKFFKLYNQSVNRAETYFINAQQQYEAYMMVSQEELDRPLLHPELETGGLWDSVKDFGGGVFDYTLGEKSLLDPGRYVNFAINLAKPDRTVYRHGGNFHGEGKVGLGIIDAWNASENQRFRQQADLGFIDDTNLAGQAQKFFFNVADFLAEQVYDPSTYIGAKSSRAFRSKYSDKIKGTKAIRAVSDDIASFKGALKKSKFGHALSWLLDEHKSYSTRLNDALEPLYTKQKRLATQAKTASKVHKAFRKDVQSQLRQRFKNFNTNEIRALQLGLDLDIDDANEIRRIGRQLGDSFSDIDVNKVSREIKVWRTRFNDLYELEVGSGIDDLSYDFRQGYRPYRLPSKGLDSKSAISNNDVWFAKPRTGNSVPVFRSTKDVADSFAKRLTDSNYFRNIRPMFDEISEQMTKTANKIDVAKKTVHRTPWEKIMRGIPEEALGVRGVGFGDIGIERLSDMWRKAVLKYRPAWYLNNEIYNQLVGQFAGGGRQYLINQKNWKNILGELKYTLKKSELEEVVGKYSQFIGQGRDTFGFAVNQETRARVALYKVFRDMGFEHSSAVTELNNWLLDYMVRNFERPIRLLSPFYKFQAGVLKTGASLYARNPRAGKAVSIAHRELYQKPLNSLPEGGYVTVDPSTGEEIFVEPRQQFSGKLKIPFTNTWINTPFNPYNRKDFGEFSRNPIFTGIDELITNRDRWGYKLNGQQWWESFAKAFPQFTLAKDFVERNDVDVTFWLARGSALPKKKLEGKGDTLKRTLMSYMGVPSHKTWNAEEYDEKKRYVEFNRDFWSVDWKEKYPDWQKRVKAQRELADSYGFDLQEDIYDGYWSQYDTEFTASVKQKKKEAFEMQSKFWEGYWKLPKGGKGKPAMRTPYVQRNRKRWEQEKAFINNPYFDILKDWFAVEQEKYGLDLADADSYLEWVSFWRTYWDSPESERQRLIDTAPRFLSTAGGHRTIGALIEEARKLGLAEYRKTPKGQFWAKFFSIKDDAERYRFYSENWRPEYGGKGKGNSDYRNTPKGQFWAKFFAIKDSDERFEFYAENWRPEFGGKGLEDPEETLFWIRYYDSPREIRNQMLAENPEYIQSVPGKKTDEVIFWIKYFNSNPDIRRQMIDENPQYVKDLPELSPEEFDEMRAKRFAENKEKLEDAPGFEEGMTDWERYLQRTAPRRQKRVRIDYV